MPGVPPKEMEDYNDYEQREGYFARLEKAKSMRHAPPGGGGGAAAPPPIALERPGSLRAVLSRQASLPADWRIEEPRPGDPVSPRTPLGPGGEPPPPRSLPPNSPPAARLDALRASRPRDARKYSWWDKMGSSALNEKPDEDDRDGGRGYVPQFAAAGQELHYRLAAAAAADAGGATAGAEEESPPVVHAAA
ncbi:hypothetical protein Rsub_05168 [Raphidocelis subcapitata]|uniref:Uncharacterized protein n=1 Tax=Raphidocelis subcapitata TaxID=307507 RepID=A0A2V0NY50_9CHLO|nr:hypothetical protein Rsub_05168 [Raphidocelis subcapitata]|eukprot:GBF92554.1 hypothetical protein Rsub_05168 [Raphidocelis subcapitata]